MIPILKEIQQNEIINDTNKKTNFLIEGDNIYSLQLLEKTHKNKIDVIIIDVPYNTLKNNFQYNDTIIDKKDNFKHSKWLSFMNKRLIMAKQLLSPTGVIIINIDENEVAQLMMLMNEIYGEKNNIGTIIYNKQNPKGDAHKISTMHEYILIYANNYNNLKHMETFCRRKKPNAEKIIKKAKYLYNKIGKTDVPDEIKKIIQSIRLQKH